MALFGQCLFDLLGAYFINAAADLLLVFHATQSSFLKVAYIYMF
jgi:hypothetical protein